MLNRLKSRLPRRELLQFTATVLALILVCVPFTVGAILSFPIWDDAWLWLLIKEHGVHAIVPTFRDRPVNARLWHLLATSEQMFWFFGLLAQAIIWPMFGVTSALLWNRLFPSLRRYAFVAACVAVAPFVTKVQMVTFNIALASLLSVMLGYGALLLLLCFVADGSRFGRVALLLSLPLLGCAILIQEYALSVALVMLVLLSSYLYFAPDIATRTRARYAVLFVIVVTVSAYAIYLLLGDPGARPSVRPQNALALGGYDLVRLPFKLMSAIWRSVVGGFASSLGELAWMSKLNLVAAGYGALVAGLLFYGSRNRNQASLFRHEDNNRDVLLLAVALAAGLMPLLATGRMPWDPADGMSSRFGLPVIPIVAALTVRMAIGLVRPRLSAVPVVLLGLTAGTTAVTESWSAVSERRAVTALGKALEPYVSSSEGYTVAVVPLPERTLGPRRQWELTARLSATWSRELGQKFWAYRLGGGAALHYKEEAQDIFGNRESCKMPHNIDVELKMGSLDRGLMRKGRLDRLLWAGFKPDGSILVEPYCIGDRPAGTYP